MKPFVDSVWSIFFLFFFSWRKQCVRWTREDVTSTQLSRRNRGRAFRNSFEARRSLRNVWKSRDSILRKNVSQSIVSFEKSFVRIFVFAFPWKSVRSSRGGRRKTDPINRDRFRREDREKRGRGLGKTNTSWKHLLYSFWYNNAE